MPSLHHPPRETARLEALRRLELLDTPPSESFDRITRMAAALFHLPVAAVSLTDSERQWFKSKVGVGHCEIPRLRAPCAAVADEGRMLVIPDLLEDAHFRDSTLAGQGVRFYAGAPLMTSDGYCLGALCVLGLAPRQASEAECAALQDLAAMVMAQIELQHALGRIDPTSGLPNRQQFISDVRDLRLAEEPGAQRLAALVSLASPEQLSEALRVMGAAYLDEIVREAQPQLRQLAGGAKLYQVGSTQFAFVAAQDAQLDDLCAHMLEWLATRQAAGQARFITTTTIGVAPFTVGFSKGLDVLRNMHSAAHDALGAERGVRVFSSEQDAVYRRRFWLVSEFGAALERPQQLRLVFQPKVGLGDGACASVEALLRWTHPEHGPVSPAEFMPVVEGTSLARATTAWVLEAALDQLAAWRAEGLRLQVAVNVSAVNLEEPDFCERILDGLAARGLDPASLALELTESALMRNPQAAHAALERLAGAGVQLAIDDFGTGYSSLAYLQSLPAKVVKIDQSFVRGIGHDGRKRALVETMIKLAHDLGHDVVAEGVETEDEARVLRAARCDQAQGFLYARPMEALALGGWLGERELAALAQPA
ncbi:sensor domain-containing phosphodiesterase [Massilia sp. KIM]|uniref:sensor domain-containing phosphodiesterase n=1 Tax=Massilia sp. KIM TaxID=1955422 RepID=UPI00098E98D8|nr:EAL domain-containing protein [Massilia sp. KIM]OON60356.1 sensor domain-containing phosphodiesterase [Massilia sp. KIM]